MNWRHYLILALLGLAVSAMVAAFQPMPGYMDADYYYAGGLQLASGRGFTEPYLWNYLDDPTGLPHPSHAYWMPLASLLAALSMTLSGHHSWLTARLGFLALSALLPPLTAALSYSLTSRRDLAFVSGLLAVFTGYYAPFLSVTDTFAIYMLLGGLFFLIVSRRPALSGGEGSPVANLALGVIAGFMYLSRADGLLWLLLALIAVIIFTPKSSSSRITFYVLRIISSLAGFLLVASAWLVRNFLVFGTFLAPGGSRALWLTEYNDLFAYPASQLTLQSWWQSGLGEILKIRLWAFGLNLGNALAMQGDIFLLPLILIGIWHFRKDNRIRLAVSAWILTFLAMIFAFPFAGARGGFIHSGAALQSMWWAVAPLGLDRLIIWLAQRRNWPEKQSRNVFLAGMVGLSIMLTAVIIQTRVMGGWGQQQTAYSQINKFIVEQGASDEAVVIVANPPGYYLASGRPAIAVPNGGDQTVLAVAARYGAQYLVLEENSVPDGLLNLYQQPEGHAGFRYLGEVEEARIFAIEP